MDEPFAALDEITRFRLNDDLLALWQALGKTVVFVTHSVFESVYLSQRILVMTPCPGRVSAEVAIEAPYPRDARFRTSADYAGYCRRVSEALASAMGQNTTIMCPKPTMTMRTPDSSERRASAGIETRPRRELVLRVVLPVAFLALGVALWELLVHSYAIPPYVLPSPNWFWRRWCPIGRCCRPRSRSR